MFVPNQTFVGIALYDPCGAPGAVMGLSSDCGYASSTAVMARSVLRGGPTPVFLSNASGAAVVRNGDQVNLYNGSCDTPRVLGNAGSMVQWVGVGGTTVPPQWTVYIEAQTSAPGSYPMGTPISPMQPVVLRSNNAPYQMCALAPGGQLILADVSTQASCSAGYGVPAPTNAAYFIFTAASDAIQQSWTLPVWLPSFFPNWWQPMDGWWPSWWQPSSRSCPHWVPGCPGYRPFPGPHPGPFPGPHPDGGCLASAGYSWCAAKGKCIRPWEEACTPVVPGSDRDEHGCIASAGYSWSPEQSKCIRPWEKPLIGGDGGGIQRQQNIGGGGGGIQRQQNIGGGGGGIQRQQNIGGGGGGILQPVIPARAPPAIIGGGGGGVQHLMGGGGGGVQHLMGGDGGGVQHLMGGGGAGTLPHPSPMVTPSFVGGGGGGTLQVPKPLDYGFHAATGVPYMGRVGGAKFNPNPRI